MKPLQRLTITALKGAIVAIAAFTFYGITEELEKMWNQHFPTTIHLHDHYARLLHLGTVFAAEFIIGLLMYKFFNHLE